MPKINTFLFSPPCITSWCSPWLRSIGSHFTFTSPKPSLEISFSRQPLKQLFNFMQHSLQICLSENGSSNLSQHSSQIPFTFSDFLKAPRQISLSLRNATSLSKFKRSSLEDSKGFEFIEGDCRRGWIDPPSKVEEGVALLCNARGENM